MPAASDSCVRACQLCRRPACGPARSPARNARLQQNIIGHEGGGVGHDRVARRKDEELKRPERADYRRRATWHRRVGRVRAAYELAHCGPTQSTGVSHSG